MHKLAVLALFLCLSSALGARSPAELFNGAYSFINSSRLENGVHIPVAVGRVGSIMYSPAYPGALYGNMSVVYGIPRDQNASLDCMTVLSGHSAYTGPYEVFPERGYVAHYPVVTSNPISGHTPRGLPAIRYFQSYDNDNIISVESRPDITYIFWRRDFPFPAGPTCKLSAQVEATGSSWIQNGATHQKYTVVLKNVGEATITAAEIEVNLALTSSISTSWNINHKSGNGYTVPLPGGLAPGQTSTATGFIVAGATSVTVAVPPSATVCN